MAQKVIDRAESWLKLSSPEPDSCEHHTQRLVRDLLAVLTGQTRQREQDFPHMCQDGHERIGHRDSSSELCRLCRERNRAEHAEAALAGVQQERDEARLQISILEHDKSFYVDAACAQAERVGKAELALAGVSRQREALEVTLQRYRVVTETLISEWWEADTGIRGGAEDTSIYSDMSCDLRHAVCRAEGHQWESLPEEVTAKYNLPNLRHCRKCHLGSDTESIAMADADLEAKVAAALRAAQTGRLTEEKVNDDEEFHTRRRTT